ncbi:hypothetical protein WV31_05155 [Magnetospirillum sp. ME-1]|uniref:hypothetical protein n=1 Tax=Magnetospirillum sp. ME-1 TaxID=1639348 RepID=UPI000A17BD7A|nr:hypothetical protein [Magnetospirillum sp. ME-1]ARJ65094.1 hypothetical protein WV31_05155 [Magnetospirillum sp. ME-1]
MSAVVVHCLDQARAALADAKADRPVSLISPPGTAGFQGIGWWRALCRILRDEFPDHTVETVLDCGESPGLALAAIRAGIPAIRVADLCPSALMRLRDIARQAGVQVISPGNV